ncbi:uncharacterized protein LOC122306417 [Carya illinoinensis]|uniref:uncharacterized protein LOC122306417 n=1 Tax=Carya illinoinensis TaxID=32201 RepID=UPI001C72165E|nr:uncharacterized protein LOC122306417 [Carya illinoinensis]
MEEELSFLCKGLRLTEEEQQEILLPKEELLIAQDISNLCLAALVVSERGVNKGAFKATMTRIWNAEGGLSFKDFGRNKFLIEFQNLSVKNKVLAGRPWSFDRSLICLQECKGKQALKDIQFELEPFWIQLHDLPFAGLNRTMGEKLGASAVKVLTVEVDEKGRAWGGVLRVKIPFKYERLPSFCYLCGTILHSHSNYSRQAIDESFQPASQAQYGSWLRATAPHKTSSHQPQAGSPVGRVSGRGQHGSSDEQSAEFDWNSCSRKSNDVRETVPSDPVLSKGDVEEVRGVGNFQTHKYNESLQRSEKEASHSLEVSDAAAIKTISPKDQAVHLATDTNMAPAVETLQKLHTEEGQILTSPEDIGPEFQAVFMDLFTSSNPNISNSIMEVLNTTVTPEMNLSLTKAYTKEEIELAIHEMNPLGSPGPDGFLAIFFQSHWLTVGKDVTDAVLEHLNTKAGFQAINHTYITLIPKKNSPRKVTDYRPISLCNVYYKIIAKVLANRLKTILPKLISDTQSAFVPGRMISDNTIVAYELLHSMQNRRKNGREAYMALKLDMSKAYDRLEWSFIHQVLQQMGFDREWTDLIMQCTGTVTYSILVNGIPQPSFKPSRGIRQGDPLSPYLFILCSEVLSSALNLAEQQGSISGFPLSRGSITVNHLFFADDSMVFCKAHQQEWTNLQLILNSYEASSSQRLNLDKSSIYFSKNTSQVAQNSILNLAGMKASGPFEKYLGLPSSVGKNKGRAFNPILDRIKAQMSNWKTNLLSSAGKESEEVIPLYGKGKQDGGLGFRAFEDFNKAMLAKQGWRLLINTQSLASKVLKAKYFPFGDFLSAKVRGSDSFVWKSITAARPLLAEGLLWKIGNGNSVKVWLDRWLPTPTSFKVQSPLKILSSGATVNSLIDQDTHSWNLALIQDVFIPEEVAVISKLHISPCSSSDRLTWRCTTNGMFTVKSAYHLQVSMNDSRHGQGSQPPTQGALWKQLWKLKVPSKVKVFIWRAAKDILPTKANLSEEQPFHELLADQLSLLPTKEHVELALTATKLWHRRNKFVFESSFISPLQVSKFVSSRKSEVEELNSQPKKQPLPTQAPVVWCKPPTDFYKINRDAAIDKVNCMVGIGVAVRYWDGLVTATLRSPKNSFPDPLLGEALAALRAVQLGLEIGLHNVIFEGDSKLVVSGINSCAEDWSTAGLIFLDIKKLLLSYHTWSFRHVPRQINVVARTLAKSSLELGEESVLVEDYPQCICNLFCS